MNTPIDLTKGLMTGPVMIDLAGSSSNTCQDTEGDDTGLTCTVSPQGNHAGRTAQHAHERLAAFRAEAEVGRAGHSTWQPRTAPAPSAAQAPAGHYRGELPGTGEGASGPDGSHTETRRARIPARPRRKDIAPSQAAGISLQNQRLDLSQLPFLRPAQRVSLLDDDEDEDGDGFREGNSQRPKRRRMDCSNSKTVPNAVAQEKEQPAGRQHQRHEAPSDLLQRLQERAAAAAHHAAAAAAHAAGFSAGDSGAVNGWRSLARGSQNASHLSVAYARARAHARGLPHPQSQAAAAAAAAAAGNNGHGGGGEDGDLLFARALQREEEERAAREAAARVEDEEEDRMQRRLAALEALEAASAQEAGPGSWAAHRRGRSERASARSDAPRSHRWPALAQAMGSSMGAGGSFGGGMSLFNFLGARFAHGMHDEEGEDQDGEGGDGALGRVRSREGRQAMAMREALLAAMRSRSMGSGMGMAGAGSSRILSRHSVLAMQEEARKAGIPPELVFSDRDFTAEDYEALLRLDNTVENKKGAKAEELDRLPIEVLDASHAGCGGEAPASCAVCCEEMRAGELVKCLPCAHRYHVSCIDQWLQQKAVCPICQCSIKQDGL